ncbi:mucin-5AC [Teleopsis dalmanni]|uniref:mucin-5AC n=1 Tax=Teleopsis dalmanni TaxID=139649 RepID=UPI0018CDCD35|nr:mucin-5AC [Teleopsis dalmanni]
MKKICILTFVTAAILVFGHSNVEAETTNFHTTPGPKWSANVDTAKATVTTTAGTTTATTERFSNTPSTITNVAYVETETETDAVAAGEVNTKSQTETPATATATTITATMTTATTATTTPIRPDQQSRTMPVLATVPTLAKTKTTELIVENTTKSSTSSAGSTRTEVPNQVSKKGGYEVLTPTQSETAKTQKNNIRATMGINKPGAVAQSDLHHTNEQFEIEIAGSAETTEPIEPTAATATPTPTPTSAPQVTATATATANLMINQQTTSETEMQTQQSNNRKLAAVLAENVADAVAKQSLESPEIHTGTLRTLNNDIHTEGKLGNGLYRIKLAEIVTDEFNGLTATTTASAEASAATTTASSMDATTTIGTETTTMETTVTPEFTTTSFVQQLEYEVDENTPGDESNNNDHYSSYAKRNRNNAPSKLNIIDLFPMKIEDFNPIIRDSNKKLVEERTGYTQHHNSIDMEEQQQNLLPNEVELRQEKTTSTSRSDSVDSAQLNRYAPALLNRDSISDFTGKVLAEKDGVITEIEQKFRLNEFVGTEASVATATGTGTARVGNSTPNPNPIANPTSATQPHLEPQFRPAVSVEQLNVKHGKFSFNMNHRSGAFAGHEFIDRRVKKSFELPMHRVASDVMSMPHIDFANTKFNTDTHRQPATHERSSSATSSAADKTTFNIATGAHPEFSTTKFYNSKELYNEMLLHNKQNKLKATDANELPAVATASTLSNNNSNVGVNKAAGAGIDIDIVAKSTGLNGNKRNIGVLTTNKNSVRPSSSAGSRFIVSHIPKLQLSKDGHRAIDQATIITANAASTTSSPIKRVTLKPTTTIISTTKATQPVTATRTIHTAPKNEQTTIDIKSENVDEVEELTAMKTEETSGAALSMAADVPKLRKFQKELQRAKLMLKTIRSNSGIITAQPAIATARATTMTTAPTIIATKLQQSTVAATKASTFNQAHLPAGLTAKNIYKSVNLTQTDQILSNSKAKSATTTTATATATAATTTSTGTTFDAAVDNVSGKVSFGNLKLATNTNKPNAKTTQAADLPKPTTPTTPTTTTTTTTTTTLPSGILHQHATNPTKSFAPSKPIARPRVLSRLQEKINSLECEIQNVPQDSHLWRGNETHELLLPIVSSENCKGESNCQPLAVSWQGEAEIQYGDILIVEINDALLNGRNTSRAHPIQVYQVTRSGHEHCDATEGILLDITPLVVDGRKLVTLYDKDLTEGVNLLIVVSELWAAKCVRLKVTTKTENCGESADCSGKGVCYSSPAIEEYECQCCSGFAGPHCEEIDACTPSPCTNNGICIDLSQGHEGNSYQCLCPYGYTGKNCQYESDPCNPAECMNGGSCAGNSTHFRCDCTPGYTGPLCQHSLNECESSPCVHGICVDQEDGFRCFCQPGFAGEICNFEYNECESNPCQNGGECIDHIGSYECRCTKGYTGKRCQIKVDFCASRPCPEGHRCIDHENDFSCECPGGRNGPDCNQMPRTQCNVNPCTNGGTCWTSGESFYCACRPGYTGTMCEDEFVVETVVSSSEFMVDDASARNFNDKTFGSSSVLKSPIELHNAYFAAGVLAAAIFIVFIVVTICHCKVNQTYRKFSTRTTTFLPILGFGRRPKTQNKLNKHWLSGKGLNSGNPLRSSSKSRGHLPASNAGNQCTTGSTLLHNNQQPTGANTTSTAGQLPERPFQRHLAMNLENDMYYTVDFTENSQHSPLIQ